MLAWTRIVANRLQFPRATAWKGRDKAVEAIASKAHLLVHTDAFIEDCLPVLDLLWDGKPDFPHYSGGIPRGAARNVLDLAVMLAIVADAHVLAASLRSPPDKEIL